MTEQYIQQYGPRLFALALKLCRNREDAEDLYQETWLKAYRFFDRYDPEKDFAAWLTSICVNAYRDMLRRQRWRGLLTVFHSNEDKDFAMANIPAREGEDHSDVREAVNGLPEKYRLAVILHYYNGLDLKKTAQVLAIPEGTVKYHLHKAREILKRRLAADEPAG